MNPCPSSDNFAFGVKCYGKLKQGIQNKQNWLQRPEILNALKYWKVHWQAIVTHSHTSLVSLALSQGVLTHLKRQHL
jgi:hypothetical protein